MTGNATPRGRPRRWWLGAAVLLLIGAAAFWLYRPVSAAIGLIGLMRDDGLEFRLISLDTDHLVLRDLHFGQPATVEADEVEVGYSIGGLFSGRIDRLILRDGFLGGRFEDGRISFGTLDDYLGGDGGGAALAIDRLQLQNATVSLATPAGTVRLGLSGTGRLGDNGLSASGDFSLLHDQASGHGMLEFAQDGQALRLHAALREGSFALPGLAGELTRAEADLARTEDGKLSIAVELATGTLRQGERELGQVLVTAGMQGDDLRGSATLLSGDTRAGGALNFTVSGLSDAEPTVALAGHLATAGLTPFRPLLPEGSLPEGLDLAGRIDFDLYGLLNLAALRAGTVRLPGAPPVVAGTATLTLDNLDMPGVVRGLSASLPFSLDTDATGIVVSFSEEASIGLPGLAGLQAAGGTSLLALSPELAGPLKLDLRSAGDGAPWLRTRLRDGGVTAEWDVTSGMIAAGKPLMQIDSAGESRIDRETWALTLPILQADAEALHLAGIALRDLKLSLSGDGNDSSLAGKLSLSGASEDVASGDVLLRAPRFSFSTPFTLTDGHLKAGSEGCLKLESDGLKASGHSAVHSPLVLCGNATAWLDHPLGKPGPTTARMRLQPLTAKLSGPDGPVLAEIDTGRLALEGRYEQANGAWQVAVAAQEPLTATIPAQEIEISRAIPKALIRHRPGRPIDVQARLDNARIVHAAAAPLFAPLELSLQGLSDGRLVQGDGTLSLAAGAIALPLRINHDFASGIGSLAVGTAEEASVVFAPGLLQPQDILLVVKGKVTDVAGQIDMLAGAYWAPGRNSTAGRLVLKDGAAQTELAALKDVNMDLTMDSLWPPQSKPHQRITIGRVNLGIPLENGSIDFTVSGEHVDIHRAAWPFAGGELFLEQDRLALSAGDQNASLKARDLDLQQLLALLRADDLSATGQIGGTLPLRLEGEKLLVAGGHLSTTEKGGTIRYLAEPPGGVAESGEQVALLFKALKNFQYRSLMLDVDGDLAGALSIQAHILGANPEVYDGHAFELNLDLSGDLAALIRQGLATTNIPENIRRSLEEQESPK